MNDKLESELFVVAIRFGEDWILCQRRHPKYQIAYMGRSEAETCYKSLSSSLTEENVRMFKLDASTIIK